MTRKPNTGQRFSAGFGVRVGRSGRRIAKARRGAGSAEFAIA